MRDPALPLSSVILRRAFAACLLALSPLLVAAGCGSSPPPLPTSAAPPRPEPPPPPTVTVATALPAASDAADAGDADAAAGDSSASAEGPSACPAGMKLVDTLYCPKVRLRCLKEEYDKPNHITICHKFAEGQTCQVTPRRQRFCIDEYEYPNKKGAHPPVMVSWHDGEAACEAEGKRLCRESEWVAACEGPEKLPFPYGRSRDPQQCNIDNAYVGPHLDLVYSSNQSVQDKELLALDQSVASGEKAGCVSGFGVHDLTGNVDEWVTADEDTHKPSRWAGLKGGAWGHVRNACRPMTTSHPPEFTYYFISFRCCGEATGEAEAEKDGKGKIWKAPPLARHPAPGKVSKGWTTTERGPNRP
jgi:sulfatase modifying factor 1